MTPAVAGGEQRRSRLVTAVLLAVLVAAFGLTINHVVARDLPGDFNVYYLAAEAFVRGEDPYAISDAFPSPRWDALAAELGIKRYAKPYRYPPQTAVLVMPLRVLGPQGALVVWEVVNAAAMIAAAWLLGRALGGGWWTPIALVALLLCGPAYDTLLTGQINGLLFFSLALALWLLERRREGGAGVALAVGGALKLVPLIVVAFLLLRRRWRLALAAAATLVALTALCLPFVGLDGVLAYGRHAVDLTRPGAVFNGATNQTITGVFGRLLDGDHARLLARLAGIALLLATAAVSWPRGDAGRWLKLEFATMVVVISVVFPFTWYHQLVVLLIPLLIVVQEAWRRGSGWLVAVIALVAFSASTNFILWSGAVRWRWHGWAASLWTDGPFVLALALWSAAAVYLLRGKLARGAGAEPGAGSDRRARRGIISGHD